MFLLDMGGMLGEFSRHLSLSPHSAALSGSIMYCGRLDGLGLSCDGHGGFRYMYMDLLICFAASIALAASSWLMK